MGQCPPAGPQPRRQPLLQPGAWLVARGSLRVQLEVAPLPPGLCSPPSVAQPTGHSEVGGERCWEVWRRHF